MARIIEFQIPENRRPKAQVIITITRGKVIEFPAVSEKNRTADRDWAPCNRPDSRINL